MQRNVLTFNDAGTAAEAVATEGATATLAVAAAALASVEQEVTGCQTWALD